MRKCILKGDNKKAYFHRWVEHSYIVEPDLLVGGQTKYVRALVELEEDGQVLEVVPEEIVFKEPPERALHRNKPYIPEMFGKQKEKDGISEAELEKMPEFLRKVLQTDKG